MLKLFYILMLAHLSAFAQSEIDPQIAAEVEAMPLEKIRAFSYHQDHFQLYDPTGDEMLKTLRLFRIIKRNKEMLSGQMEKVIQRDLLMEKRARENFTTLADEYKKYLIFVDGTEPKPYIEQPGNPFKLDNVKKMFAQVIWEETQKGMPPIDGEFHRWAPGFKQRYWYWKAGKIFTALTLGVTARFMYVGHEFTLLDWICEQADRSITLDKMFRKSYQLNNGDVYLSLLLIENVLSYFWKEGPKRENILLTRKLSIISKVKDGRGDIFGTWYHMFGLMLYGYVDGALMTRLIADIETLTSRFITGFKAEDQEDQVNRQSGSIGAYLRKFVKKKKYLEHSNNPNLLKPDNYLDLQCFLVETPAENSANFFSLILQQNVLDSK